MCACGKFGGVCSMHAEEAQTEFGVWQRVAAKFAYMLVQRADPSLSEAEVEHQGAVLLRHALDIEQSEQSDEGNGRA